MSNWRVRSDWNQNGSKELHHYAVKTQSLNTLYHYGIKGMKWGVRRTPEQLGHNRKAGDIENVGAKKLDYYSLAAEKAKAYVKEFGINAAALGLAFVAPPLAGPLEIGMFARVIANAVGIDKESFNSNERYLKKDGPPEKLKDLRKKSSKTTMEEDAVLVNQGSKTGRTKNCMCCVATLEMRQRGYDVVARRRTAGFPTSAYGEWFNNFEMKLAGTKLGPVNINRKEKIEASYNDLTNKLEKYPEGARGYVAFTYSGSKSGHTISWEIKNGEATFFDSQSKTPPDKTLSFSDGLYEYGRLDNLTVKPAITSVVVSRKEKA